MFSIVCRLLCDPVARMEAIKGTLTRIQRLVMRIAKSASQSSTILTIAARRWRHPIYCEVMRLPSGRVGALSRALWWEGEPSSSSSANMGLGIGGVEKCSFLPTKKSTYFYRKVLIFTKKYLFLQNQVCTQESPLPPPLPTWGSESERVPSGGAVPSIRPKESKTRATLFLSLTLLLLIIIIVIIIIIIIIVIIIVVKERTSWAGGRHQSFMMSEQSVWLSVSCLESYSKEKWDLKKSSDFDSF